MPYKRKEVAILERQLQLKEAPKTDLEAVTRAFTHGDIVLNKQQQELSDRLLFVDAHLRMRRRNNDAIIRMTMKKFGVTRYRAERDIVETMKLFGESRKLNKAYLVSHHINEIQRQIQTCIEKGVMDLIPKLNDNLIYALNSLPVEADQRESPPAQIIFVYNAPSPVKEESLEDVLNQADSIIKNPTNGDYLEFAESDHPGAEPSADDGSDDPGQ